jgi:hypothetical protein
MVCRRCVLATFRVDRVSPRRPSSRGGRSGRRGRPRVRRPCASAGSRRCRSGHACRRPGADTRRIGCEHRGVELPTPAAHGLPDDATIAVPVPAAGLTLHRLLEHEAPRARDFEPKFSRNQAKSAGLPELFRGSISHWLEHEQSDREVGTAHLVRRPRRAWRLRKTDKGRAHGEEGPRSRRSLGSFRRSPRIRRGGRPRSATTVDCVDRVHRPRKHPRGLSLEPRSSRRRCSPDRGHDSRRAGGTWPVQHLRDRRAGDGRPRVQSHGRCRRRTLIA